MDTALVETWPLQFLKNDWFQKANKIVSVHLYAKDVTDCKVKFSEDSVHIYFKTSNEQFLHVHGPKKDDVSSTTFSYSISTSARIIPEESSFTVCKTRIELKLFKAVPDRWISLETRKAITDRNQARDTEHALSDEKQPKIDEKSSEIGNVQGSKNLKDSKQSAPLEAVKSKKDTCSFIQKKNTLGHSQSSEKLMLLGGKSTPVSKKGTEQEGKTEREAVAVSEPQIAVSAKESNIHRNMNKTVASGLTGLENYANNCYMNVVIQVLANIPEIRDYFADDHFLNSLSSNNPMSSGGRVAKAFAEVIKALWSSERKGAVRPQALKNIMGKRCNLFMGFQQCDAQEFFATLLDNLHEDMNQWTRPEKSNETTKKDDDCPSTSEKADTAWNEHFKRNNSVIVKMFHGQMVSKLTCQACHKVSTTYEACAQISVPIAMSRHKLHVIVFFRDPAIQPERIRLQISSPHAQIWHLLSMLEKHIGIPAHNLRVFQDTRGSTSLTFDENSFITSIRNPKQVIVCEVKDEKEADYVSLPFRQLVANPPKVGKCANCSKSQFDIETKLKRCTRCLYVAYCSKECQGKHWGTHKRDCRKGMKDFIGLPFFVTIRKHKLTFEALSAAAGQYASFSVTTAERESDSSEGESDEKSRTTSVSSDIDQDEKNAPKIEVALNSGAKSSENTAKPKEGENDERKRHSKLEGACNVATNDDFVIKAYTKADQDPLPVSADDFKTETVMLATYLAIEWQNNQIKEKDLKEVNIPFKRVQGNISEDEGLDFDRCSIEDCFSLFLEPERLLEKDGWKCPKCKTVQAVKKEMALSYPPPVLLVHFKRFTYATYGQKVAKGINYPISGLDLSYYIAEETRGLVAVPPLYDLIGVISHKGSMGIGHYTCMVRNLNQQGQPDIGWRYFDDDNVLKIDDERVVDSSAYVLVYRMRGTAQALKSDHPFALFQAAANEGNQEKVGAVARPLNRHLSVESGMKAHNKSQTMENSTAKENVKQSVKRYEENSRQDLHDAFFEAGVKRRSLSEPDGFMQGPNASEKLSDVFDLRKDHESDINHSLYEEKEYTEKEEENHQKHIEELKQVSESENFPVRNELSSPFVDHLENENEIRDKLDTATSSLNENGIEIAACQNFVANKYSIESLNSPSQQRTRNVSFQNDGKMSIDDQEEMDLKLDLIKNKTQYFDLTDVDEDDID